MNSVGESFQYCSEFAMNYIRCALLFWIFFKLVFIDGDNFVACQCGTSREVVNCHLQPLLQQIDKSRRLIEQVVDGKPSKSIFHHGKQFIPGLFEKRKHYLLLLQALHRLFLDFTYPEYSFFILNPIMNIL